MTNDCPQFGKVFGGCHFEARYDHSPADLGFGEIKTSAQAAIMFAETMRAKTYVKDVCTRCGRTVERTPP